MHILKEMFKIIKESSFKIISESTIHGIPNIFKKKILFSKLIWIVATLVCFNLCLLLVAQSILAYLENDVVTSIKKWKSTPLAFPVISFCNLNKFNTINKYNLSDLLIYCEFNGIECNSNDFISFYDMNYGLCYRFNSNSTFKSNKAGKLNGFKIDILTGLEEDFLELGSISNGLHVYIHNKSFLPSISEGVEIATGFVTNLMIRQIFNYRQPEPFNDCKLNPKYFQNNLSYRQKDCFDIKFLQYFSTMCNYSSQNIMEIIKEFHLRLLLEKDSETIFECLFKANQNFYNQINFMLNDLDCPQECDSMYYEITTSMSKFPSKSIYLNLLKNNKFIKLFKSNNFSHEQLNESYLAFRVYFENLEYTEIRQEIKTTIIDLISNIGGLLGLFLGMSFLSFFEFLELFAQIIWILFHKNNPNALKNLKQEENPGYLS